MTISRATKQDVIDVCLLGKKYQTEYSKHILIDSEYAAQQYHKLLEQQNSVMYVLKCDGVVVGGIAGLAYPDIHSGKLVGVETFWFVDKPYRGQGLELLTVFEQWCKIQGCDQIAMIHLVDSHPEVLEKIYVRRGYNLVEKHYVKEL